MPRRLGLKNSRRKDNLPMDEIILTDKNFEEEVTQSKLPVLVDFWAPWCGPCLMLASTIEELARELKGKIKIGKVSVEENQNLAGRFQIMSIPTLILFKEGKVAFQTFGACRKDSLLAKLSPFVNF